MEYLLDEDYGIAEANGIGRKTLYNRFHNMAWDKQRAMTTPVMKAKGKWNDWIDKAEANGIHKKTFLSRINRGYTPEEALNKPFATWRGSKQKYIPPEIRAKAEANGIGVKTLQGRVYYLGWDMERAATQPIDTRRRRKGWK